MLNVGLASFGPKVYPPHLKHETEGIACLPPPPPLDSTNLHPPLLKTQDGGVFLSAPLPCSKRKADFSLSVDTPPAPPFRTRGQAKRVGSDNDEGVAIPKKWCV